MCEPGMMMLKPNNEQRLLGLEPSGKGHDMICLRCAVAIPDFVECEGQGGPLIEKSLGWLRGTLAELGIPEDRSGPAAEGALQSRCQPAPSGPASSSDPASS